MIPKFLKKKLKQLEDAKKRRSENALHDPSSDPASASGTNVLNAKRRKQISSSVHKSVINEVLLLQEDRQSEMEKANKLFDEFCAMPTITPKWDKSKVGEMKKLYQIMKSESIQLSCEYATARPYRTSLHLAFDKTSMDLAQTARTMKVDVKTGEIVECSTWSRGRGVSLLSTALQFAVATESEMILDGTEWRRVNNVARVDIPTTSVDTTRIGDELKKSQIIASSDSTASLASFVGVATTVRPVFQALVTAAKSPKNALNSPVIVNVISDWGSDQLNTLSFLIFYFSSKYICWVISRCRTHIVNLVTNGSMVALWGFSRGADEIRQWEQQLYRCASLLRHCYSCALTNMADNFADWDILLVDEGDAMSNEEFQDWRWLVDRVRPHCVTKREKAAVELLRSVCFIGEVKVVLTGGERVYLLRLVFD